MARVHYLVFSSIVLADGVRIWLAKEGLLILMASQLTRFTMLNRHRHFNNHVFSILIMSSVLLVSLTLATRSLGKESASGWIEDNQPAPGNDRKTQPPPKITTTTTNSGKPLLQGGVEHSESLPALPRSLSVGADFNQALLSAAPPIDGWYWIPDWLAGDWRRDEETIVSSVDFLTGQENRQPHTISAIEIAQFGVQRDRFGGVWHCRLATNGMADCGDYLSVALVQSQEPVVVSQEKVIVRDVFTELHVNKETHAIIYSAQAESLTRYQPMHNGTLNTITSLKTFDENGTPLKGQRNQSFIMRTKQFVPVDAYKGKDLRTLFRQFLVSQGKADYVP